MNLARAAFDISHICDNVADLDIENPKNMMNEYSEQFQESTDSEEDIPTLE